jgi:hypothetical protein
VVPCGPLLHCLNAPRNPCIPAGQAIFKWHIPVPVLYLQSYRFRTGTGTYCVGTVEEHTGLLFYVPIVSCWVRLWWQSKVPSNVAKWPRSWQKMSINLFTFLSTNFHCIIFEENNPFVNAVTGIVCGGNDCSTKSGLFRLLGRC